MNRPRIILIEDHAMVSQLLGALIGGQLGLDLCATCQTVQAGREAILANQPDLAIVDWKLPDGRGFDLVRELAPKLPGLKWLFMSATEQGHVVREAVTLGVQGFVQKRSELGILRTAIGKLLAGENYYCPASSHLLVATLVDEGRDAKASLTARECEILRRFARGSNIKIIADELGISVKTAQNHLTQLKEKLGLHEPAELVHYAIKHGYIETP
jgi:DNA-binding NarL/FixJ family response regulator